MSMQETQDWRVAIWISISFSCLHLYFLEVALQLVMLMLQQLPIYIELEE